MWLRRYLISELTEMFGPALVVRCITSLSTPRGAMTPRLSALALVALALLTTGCAAKRGGAARRNNRGRKSPRCPITGCQRCNNQTSCQVCRPGFALTEDEKCGSCGSHCSTCTRAGPGHCDVCSRGYTLHTETRQLPGLPAEDTHPTCEKCAKNCNACDISGPNKCDTCGPRHMLDVRMELHDEVHECVPCGTGCRKCSAEVGCKTCAWLIRTLTLTLTRELCR